MRQADRTVAAGSPRNTRRAVGMLPLALAAAAGFALAATGETYDLDPVHSRVGFSIGHLSISTVKGEFTNFTGRIVYKEGEMKSASAESTIRADSIYTAQKARDEHVKGEDFLSAAAFPQISFKSQEMAKEGDKWYLVGTLTMHGVSKPVKLETSITGPIKDPWGMKRIGFQAKTSLNRQDFGVGSKKAVDKAIGDTVAVEIEAEAVTKE